MTKCLSKLILKQQEKKTSISSYTQNKTAHLQHSQLQHETCAKLSSPPPPSLSAPSPLETQWTTHRNEVPKPACLRCFVSPRSSTPPLPSTSKPRATFIGKPTRLSRKLFLITSEHTTSPLRIQARTSRNEVRLLCAHVCVYVCACACGVHHEKAVLTHCSETVGPHRFSLCWLCSFLYFDVSPFQ